MDVTNLCSDNGLMQLVNEPTHGTNILDKFITNRPDLFSVHTVVSSVKTKHKAVLANCYSLATVPPPTAVSVKQVKQFYDIRSQHMAKLADFLERIPWDNIVNEDSDIDTVYSTFIQACHDAIQNCIPIRSVTMGKKDPHFFSPLVKTLVRKRNRLLRKAKLEQADVLRVKIGELISDNKRKLIDKANDGDVRALWRAVKQSSSSRDSKNVIFADTALNDADQLNNFFANISTDPDYNIRHQNTISRRLSTTRCQLASIQFFITSAV